MKYVRSRRRRLSWVHFIKYVRPSTTRSPRTGNVPPEEANDAYFRMQRTDYVKRPLVSDQSSESSCKEIEW